MSELVRLSSEHLVNEKDLAKLTAPAKVKLVTGVIIGMMSAYERHDGDAAQLILRTRQVPGGLHIQLDGMGKPSS